MISRLEGDLTAVAAGRAHVRCGPLTYEVLVPAADEQRLATQVGETVEFHTYHYLEGQGQGSSFTPRLVGFASVRDRAFFELFTTVKGMGNRKALRALAIPAATIAEAIATKDFDLLKSLPEVGKRTAETIVAELHGKVDRFVEVKLAAVAGGGSASGGGVATVAPDVVEDVVAVLVQLGESATDSRRLIERALRLDPELDTHERLLQAAYRLRGS